MAQRKSFPPQRIPFHVDAYRRILIVKCATFLVTILATLLVMHVDQPTWRSSHAGDEGCLKLQQPPCISYPESGARFTERSKWNLGVLLDTALHAEAAEVDDNSVFVYSDIDPRSEKREARGIRRPWGSSRIKRPFEKGISIPFRGTIPYTAKVDVSVETEARLKNREAAPSSTQEGDAKPELGEDSAREKTVRRFISGPFADVRQANRGAVDSSGLDDSDILNSLRQLPSVGDLPKPSLIREGSSLMGGPQERLSSFQDGSVSTVQAHVSSRSASPVSGARTRDDDDDNYEGDMGFAYDDIIPELGPLYLKGSFDGAHTRPSVEQLYDSLHLHVNAAAKALELNYASSLLRKPETGKVEGMLAASSSGVPHTDGTDEEHRGGDGGKKVERPKKHDARRLFDAWQRVNGRFLNVVPIVNVDGFLLQAARFPRFSWTRRYGRQRLPVGTPYPGMAQLLFLLSLGPHNTAPNGQPSARVVHTGETPERKDFVGEMWQGGTLDASGKHGIALWPLKPVMLASRPSRFPLFRKVFRPHVFYAQLNELIDRATKQMLHLRCISTLRRDCWSVEQRWEWGRRSGISLFKSLTAGSRLAAKASCVITELLTRMNKRSDSAANVSSRLRGAMTPLYVVDVGDQTSGYKTSNLTSSVKRDDRSVGQTQGHLSLRRDGEHYARRSDGALVASKQYDLKALPPWYRERVWNPKKTFKGVGSVVGEYTTHKQITTSADSVSVSIQDAWESKGRDVSRKSASSTVNGGHKGKHTSRSTKEIFYKFYEDPALEEPFILMGDDSPEALHLSLGLSLLATHKTAAIFVHVSADENGSGETYKNREHLVNAFKPSSFTTENGMTVPLYSLEFDVEVEGSHADTMKMVAALTSAYSRVSQSQLGILSEDLEGKSYEGRTVGAVAQPEISMLTTVGQELGKFIGAFLFQFQNCRANRKLRSYASHGTGSSLEYPQSDLKQFHVESVLNAMRTDGSVPCHLPLLILKPRFVVHKRHPVAVHRHRLWDFFRRNIFRSRSRFGPSIKVLPVISEDHANNWGDRKNGGAYVGARARRVPQWILDVYSQHEDQTLGIPVIMFRTPVHALAQSWLTGIVDLRDVFRGSSAVVQDMRSMLPLAHPSRSPLYQDVHDDLLYMLGVTANRADVIPADAQAAALLVHLIHLRERSVTVPSHSFVRSPSFDSGECHRNFEPVRLELAAWESLKDRRGVMSTPWKSALGAPGKTARFDKELARGIDKRHIAETYWNYDGWVPPGSREPPWDSINDVMIRLLAKAPRQFLGRVEKAAADLASFFCSHVPFIHFMQAAGSSEFTKFTLELAMRLQLLRREVRATVLNLTEARSPLRSQIPKPASLRSSVSQVHVGVRKAFGDSQSLSPIADVGGERSNEYFGFSDEGELRSRRSGSNLDLEPSRLHWRVGRDMVERRHGHVLQNTGLFAQESVDPNARSALEIVDLQLQIQNQVAEIASGLAADVALFAEDDAARTEFCRLVQATPELQEQLELEKMWALEQQTCRKGVIDDTCLSRYGRQHQRRQVLENILVTRQPKTASFACSLLDAAEWLHSLKEDGRKIPSISAPQSGGSDRRRFGVTTNAHFFHWLCPRSNREMLNKRGRVVEESEIHETLEDAFKFARKFRKDGISVSQQPGMGSLGNVISSRVTPECVCNKPKFPPSSDPTTRGDEHSLEINVPLEARRHPLWWERIVTSDASRLGLSPMAASVVPHLSVLLQSGLDWDCLGEDYPEANALWLFVMGRLCTNSFFCEGMSSLLFGEGMLLPDMLRVARRAASRGSDPLGLQHLDVVLDGRHEGFARSES